MSSRSDLTTQSSEISLHSVTLTVLEMIRGEVCTTKQKATKTNLTKCYYYFHATININTSVASEQSRGNAKLDGMLGNR